MPTWCHLVITSNKGIYMQWLQDNWHWVAPIAAFFGGWATAAFIYH